MGIIGQMSRAGASGFTATMRKVRSALDLNGVVARLIPGGSDVHVACAGVGPEGVYAVLCKVVYCVWIGRGEWVASCVGAAVGDWVAGACSARHGLCILKFLRKYFDAHLESASSVWKRACERSISAVPYGLEYAQRFQEPGCMDVSVPPAKPPL